MDKNEILKYVDHTLLKQEATWEDIKLICDDGALNGGYTYAKSKKK